MQSQKESKLNFGYHIFLLTYIKRVDTLRDLLKYVNTTFGGRCMGGPTYVEYNCKKL